MNYNLQLHVTYVHNVFFSCKSLSLFHICDSLSGLLILMYIHLGLVIIGSETDHVVGLEFKMKVIVAGYSKTGTKSMASALKILGYNVYDFMEHYWFHSEQWIKVLASRNIDVDFRQMYKNVDAVTDNPPYFFWEQIHEAFPDAKVSCSMQNISVLNFINAARLSTRPL